MKSFAVFVLAVILAPAAHAQHQTFTTLADRFPALKAHLAGA